MSVLILEKSVSDFHFSEKISFRTEGRGQLTHQVMYIKGQRILHHMSGVALSVRLATVLQSLRSILIMICSWYFYIPRRVVLTALSQREGGEPKSHLGSANDGSAN